MDIILTLLLYPDTLTVHYTIIMIMVHGELCRLCSETPQQELSNILGIS